MQIRAAELQIKEKRKKNKIEYKYLENDRLKVSEQYFYTERVLFLED